MELRQLEYFVTVSSLKNFTKAAQILHVSQPSVTKAIQALEAELKLSLFDRSQKLKFTRKKFCRTLKPLKLQWNVFKIVTAE